MSEVVGRAVESFAQSGDDFVLMELTGGTPTNRRRRFTAEWDARSRNHTPTVDLNFPLIRECKRVKTRVATQCIFCGLKIGRGQYRWKYTDGFSRVSNYKRTWFQLHEHCYQGLVVKCIEKSDCIAGMN